MGIETLFVSLPEDNCGRNAGGMLAVYLDIKITQDMLSIKLLESGPSKCNILFSRERLAGST